MFVQAHFAIDSMADVRRIVNGHGWALLLTTGADGLGAAHVPCLLDPDRDPGGESRELVVLGHTARRDPVSAALAEGREALLVFQGPHGYISPAWYGAGPYVPTWNFTAVHVHGTPEVLVSAEAFSVLESTVDHFETVREEPWRLDGEVRDYAERIAAGTVPFRLRATRVEAKAKLSQDKPRAVQERVVAALDEEGPYCDRALADEMRRVLGIPIESAA